MLFRSESRDLHRWNWTRLLQIACAPAKRPKTLGPLTSSASTAHPCSIWPPAYPSHPFISHCALCCPAEVCRVHGLRNSTTTALERSTHLTVYPSASPMRLYSQCYPEDILDRVEPGRAWKIPQHLSTCQCALWVSRCSVSQTLSQPVVWKPSAG